MPPFFYKKTGLFVTGCLMLILSSKAIEIKETEVNDCTTTANAQGSSSDSEEKNNSKKILLYLTECEAKNLTAEEKDYIVYNKGKKPPSRYMDWIAFIESKQCPKSFDFYQQIFEDISPFYYLENGKTISKITREIIDQANTIEYMTTISIKNHQLQPGRYMLYGLENYINEVIYLLPENIDFMYSYLDEEISLPPDDGNTDQRYHSIKDTLVRNECLRQKYNNNQTVIKPGSIAFSHGSFIAPVWWIPYAKLLPVLSFCKKDCYKDILIPVPASLPFFKDNVSWESKENKLVWRGSTTGTKTSHNTLFELSHRYRLVNWARDYKKYVWEYLGIAVDIELSAVIQCDGDCEEFKQKTVMSSLSIEEQFKSKYLIVVDGNGWTFRFPTFLGSNSLVLYNGVYNVWFSKLIKPYVHYLPIKADYSDLIEQLEYAKNHDDEMKKIAENARSFVEEFLTPNTTACYLGLMLIEYADLIKG